MVMLVSHNQQKVSIIRPLAQGKVTKIEGNKNLIFKMLNTIALLHSFFIAGWFESV